MKRILLYGFLAALILISGCQNNREIDLQARVIRITGALPTSDALRVNLGEVAGTKDINVTWQEGDKVQLYLVQNSIVKELTIPISNISNQGHNAEFSFVLPDGIDDSLPYNLYGVYGRKAKISGTNILIDCSPSQFTTIDKLKELPMYFKIESVQVGNSNLTGSFKHIGSLHVLNLHNTSDTPWTVNGAKLSSSSAWYQQTTTTDAPFINLNTSNITRDTPIASTPEFQPVSVPVNGKIQLIQWMVPNGNEVPEIYGQIGDATAVNSKPARAAMLSGKAYHLDMSWDGKKVFFTNEPIVERSIILDLNLSTNRKTLNNFHVYATDDSNTWIDLNNDGIKQEGEALKNTVTIDQNGYYKFGTALTLTPTAEKVTLYGDFKVFQCQVSSIKELDVTQQAHLNRLSVYNNMIQYLDLSHNSELKEVVIGNNGLNNGVVLPNPSKITYLDISWSRLYKGTDPWPNDFLSNQKELSTLKADYSKFDVLDLSGLSKLLSVNIENCKANGLILNEENKKIWSMKISHNNFSKDAIHSIIDRLPDKSSTQTYYNKITYRVVNSGAYNGGDKNVLPDTEYLIKARKKCGCYTKELSGMKTINTKRQTSPLLMLRRLLHL